MHYLFLLASLLPEMAVVDGSPRQQLPSLCSSYILTLEKRGQAESQPMFCMEREIPGMPDFNSPTVIKYCYREILAVRGDEVTFERTLVASKRLTGSVSIALAPYFKITNVGGTLRHLVDPGGKGSAGRIAEVRKSDGSEGNLLRTKQRLELAMGLGAQTLFVEVPRQTINGEMKILEGRARLFQDIIGTGKVHIDADNVVRKIEFDWEADGIRSRMVVHTDGTVHAAGRIFPRESRVKEFAEDKRNGVEGGPMSVQDWTYAFVDFVANPSDGQYLAAIKMDLNANVQVTDHAKRELFRLDSQGKRTSFPFPIRRSEAWSTSIWMVLLALHALLFAAGACWYLLHRRQRRPAVAG